MKRLLFLAALLLGTAAWATPPRITASEDRMMAATQTHLYVLREIVDNLGSHYTGLHDQHLVEISLESGAATRFWPLRRMHVNRLPENNFVLPGEVQDLDGSTADLTAVLREVGAQPIAPSAWGAEEVTFDNGALSLKGEVALTPFGIRALGRGQLAILRDAYPAIETADEHGAGKRIDFYDLYAKGDWLCVLHPETSVLFRAAEKLIITKLHCQDAELNGVWSFHAILKDDL
ncbi:MAG: hypothetical protein AAFW87_02300 [Pseudomonadota bacterium]